MDLDAAPFFETMMDVVARYGMKRTTMSDLAKAAGVSRQTLYDRYGDKDGVMGAVIEWIGLRTERDLQAAFANGADLDAKLDAFFEIAVWPVYDTLQRMPDAADFETGMGAASIKASERVYRRKRATLTDMLRQHLPEGGPAPDSVASFVEQSSTRAKMSSTERAELEKFLTVLKASVVALSRAS